MICVTGRKVCVLANLKDRNLAGFKSQGMVLCAVSADHTAIKLVDPPVNATGNNMPPLPLVNAVSDTLLHVISQ